jgi:hypothetical protein
MEGYASAIRQVAGVSTSPRSGAESICRILLSQCAFTRGSDIEPLPRTSNNEVQLASLCHESSGKW